MKEIWKAVLGYEGIYEASSLGKIRSLGREYNNRQYPAKTISARLIKNGRYLASQVCKDGIEKTVMVATLICEAFHGRRPPGLQVCHNNGNSLDNRANNLRWGTPKENMIDRDRHGRTKRGTGQTQAKLTDAAVRKIRALRGRVYQKDLASRYGVSGVLISRVQLGKNWKHVSS